MSSNASLLMAGPTDVPDVADLDVPDLDCFNLGRFFAPDLPDMVQFEAAAECYGPSTPASSSCCSSILNTKHADRWYMY